MPPREWKLRIEDILDAIAKIQHYSEGMSVEGFSADQRTVDAVAHNFAIIGEAARYVPSDVQQRHPEIPWGKMRGMRNVVIHEYPGVNLGTIWNTVREDLPPLVPLLRSLLDEQA